MSKYPNWSTEELELLREAYPKLGKCTELQSLFPTRPLNAITLKANRIGLKVEHDIRKKRTHEEYLAILDLEKFFPLEEYRGSTVPILHMCNLCENEWMTRPQSLLKPTALCPVCSKKSRLTTLEEVDRVLMNNSGLIRKSEYLGALKELVLFHPQCGYEWTSTYSYVQQGSGCPKCNKGFGYWEGTSLPPKAYLYVLDIIFWSGHRCVKVGVTTRDTTIRVRELSSGIGKELCNIRILRTIELSGKEALDLEREIIQDIKGGYKCPIDFPGATETLSEDTLTQVENKINDFIQRIKY